MKKLLLSFVICLFAISVIADEGDVSQLDNAVYVQNSNIAIGSQSDVSICIKTNIDAVGFQFDMYLPDGVELVYDNNKSAYAMGVGALSNNKHIAIAELADDQYYRVLCYSTNNSAFSAKDGQVLVAKLKVSDYVSAGSYPVILKNIEITKANGFNSPFVESLESTINIMDPSAIQEIEANDPSNTLKGTYTIAGQKVNSLHEGQIGIKDGIKIVKSK